MTRRADIERLLREGERLRGAGRGAGLLDVRLMNSSAGHVRVAIVVPRHGQTAVRRNRLKRQLRELARREVLPRAVSRDVLFRARPAAYGAAFADLHEAVARVAVSIGNQGAPGVSP